MPSWALHFFWNCGTGSDSYKGKGRRNYYILTVEAVCEMLLCDDAVMTHELTAQFAEGGSFQYPGNKIRNTEMGEKPPCQYRIGKEKAE